MMEIKVSVSIEINALSSYKITLSVILLLHMIRKTIWMAHPSLTVGAVKVELNDKEGKIIVQKR